MAAKIGLNEGTAISVGNVDAHVSVPAMGVTEPGKMVMTMGTSICHLLLGNEEKEVEGRVGCVEVVIIPGWLVYERGQATVGVIFLCWVKKRVQNRDENLIQGKEETVIEGRETE